MKPLNNVFAHAGFFFQPLQEFGDFFLFFSWIFLKNEQMEKSILALLVTTQPPRCENVWWSCLPIPQVKKWQTWQNFCWNEACMMMHACLYECKNPKPRMVDCRRCNSSNFIVKRSVEWRKAKMRTKTVEEWNQNDTWKCETWGKAVGKMTKLASACGDRWSRLCVNKCFQGNKLVMQSVSMALEAICHLLVGPTSFIHGDGHQMMAKQKENHSGSCHSCEWCKSGTPQCHLWHINHVSWIFADTKHLWAFVLVAGLSVFPCLFGAVKHHVQRNKNLFEPVLS